MQCIIPVHLTYLLIISWNIPQSRSSVNGWIFFLSLSRLTRPGAGHAVARPQLLNAQLHELLGLAMQAQQLRAGCEPAWIKVNTSLGWPYEDRSLLNQTTPPKRSIGPMTRMHPSTKTPDYLYYSKVVRFAIARIQLNDETSRYCDGTLHSGMET